MSTNTAILLVLGAAVITAALKAAGPVALGGRELPPRFNGFIALLAPALFTALIVTQVLADGDDLGVGADTAGLAVAGAALVRDRREGRRFGRALPRCVDGRGRADRRGDHGRPPRALTPRGQSLFCQTASRIDGRMRQATGASTASDTVGTVPSLSD